MVYGGHGTCTRTARWGVARDGLEIFIGSHMKLSGNQTRGKGEDKANGSSVFGAEAQVDAATCPLPPFGAFLAGGRFVFEDVDGTTGASVDALRFENRDQ